ncbi:MAG: hypothetical protein ACPGJV_08570 [Bacteriovoracaceae bacterium]
MGKTFIISLFALTMAVQGMACEFHGWGGIVAENSLYIPAGFKSAGGINVTQFNETLDKIEEIYGPIFKEKFGALLNVQRDWDDGTVNAYATQSGSTWIIKMFGGLARHPTISQDAFATVACHEIGHHIAGAPKRKGWWGSSSWASNEGQSDYFATSKCLRKYMENDDNEAMMKDKVLPQTVVDKCNAIFTNSNEVAMCYRTALAGLSLASLFKALRNSTDPLKFSTPDQNVVTKTNDMHPASQCRLDTYFQGGLCERSAYDDPSQTNYKTGYCIRKDGYTEGVRPLCWFKEPGA